MKKLISAALIAALPLSVFAGYEEAIKEVDNYRPATWLSADPAQAPAPVSVAPIKAEAPAAAVALPYHTPSAVAEAAVAQVWEDDSRTLALLGAKLDLDELKALALKRSPRIKAARSEAASALDSIGISRTLSESLRAYAPFTDTSMPQTGAVMKEPESFPAPSVASLRGAAAAREVEVADQKAEEETAAVLTEVQELYWELRANAVRTFIDEERLGLLATLEQSAGSRYSVGEGSMGELAMLRAEQEAAREELVTLANERKAKEDALLALLALPGGAPLATPDRGAEPPQVALSLAALKKAARDSNRPLNAMRSDLARMEAMVAMGTVMNNTPPDQGSTIFENRTAAQTGTMAMESAFSTSPSASEGVGSPRKALAETERAYLAQLSKKVSSAKAALEAEGHALDAMVSEAWTGYDAARRERFLYRDRVLEYTRLALDSSMASYRSGMGGFPMVLASYRGWLEAFTASEESAAKMGIFSAQLEKLIGQSPLPQAAGVEQKK